MPDPKAPGIPTDLLPLILEVLPVGVFVLDRKGQIVMTNPAGLRIWGGAEYVGPEEWHKYKAWWTANGKVIEQQEWAAAKALGEGVTTYDDMVDIEGFNGVRRTILNSAIPLRSAEGEIIGAITVNQDITERRRNEAEREHLVAELQHALRQVQTLSGLLPICSHCKKIRDGSSAWRRLEEFIERMTPAQFTHTLCPTCSKELYPEDG